MDPELKAYLDDIRAGLDALQQSMLRASESLLRTSACFTAPVTASTGMTEPVLASAGLTEPTALASSVVASPAVAPAPPMKTIAVAPASCSTECAAQATSSSSTELAHDKDAVEHGICDDSKPSPTAELVTVSARTAARPSPVTTIQESLTVTPAGYTSINVVAPVTCLTKCPSSDAKELRPSSTPAAAPMLSMATVDVIPVLTAAAASDETIDDEASKGAASTVTTSSPGSPHIGVYALASAFIPSAPPSLSSSWHQEHMQYHTPWPPPYLYLNRCDSSKLRPIPWPSFSDLPDGVHLTEPMLPLQGTYGDFSVVVGVSYPFPDSLSWIKTLHIICLRCELDREEKFISVRRTAERVGQFTSLGMNLNIPENFLKKPYAESPTLTVSGLIKKSASVFQLWRIPRFSFLYLTSATRYGLTLFQLEIAWQFDAKCFGYFQWHVARALSLSVTNLLAPGSHVRQQNGGCLLWTCSQAERYTSCSLLLPECKLSEATRVLFMDHHSRLGFVLLAVPIAAAKLVSLFIVHVNQCGFALFQWKIAWSRQSECSETASADLKDNLLPDVDEDIIQAKCRVVCYLVSLGVQCRHGNIFEGCPSVYMAKVMLLHRNYSPLNSWSGYTALQCTTASVVQICKLMYGNKRLAWGIISDVFLKCNQYVCCVDALKPWSLLVRMVHICWLLLQEQVSKGVAVLDTQQLRWFNISVFSVYNTLVPELVITEFQQPNLLCHHQSLVQLNYQVQDVGLESICKLSGKNTQAGLRLPDEDYLCYFLCWDSGGYTLFSLLALDRQMTMEKGRCSLISVSHLLNRYRSLSFIDYLLFNGLKVLYTPWEPDVHNAAHHAPAFVVLRRERGELIQWLANDLLGAYRIWLVAWTVGGQGTFKGGRHMPALGRHKELRTPWDPGGAAATGTQAAFDVIAATAWDQQLIGILYRNSGHNNEHRLLWDPGRFLVASAWGQAAFQGGRDVRSLFLHGLFPGATTWAWPVCQSPRAAGYINTWRRQRRGYPEDHGNGGGGSFFSHLGSVSPSPFMLVLMLATESMYLSLKATVLDADLAIVAHDAVHFDSELPHYGTEGGVRRDPAEPGRIVSPPLMWAEALDLLLQRLKPRVDYGRVAAVSGSAQQHGSVYWRRGDGSAALNSLDPSHGLATQLAGALAAPESPVWMDSSTTAQCREVEDALGGALALAAMTGCRAHERCTGPQIRKMFQTRPGVYDGTERISLVSSFMASLLIGGYACIDQTDGAGMNLMDIQTRQLRQDALEATAPDLEVKIGKLAPAHEIAGTIAPYFVQRFQFTSNCLVVQWSGDNPNSLAGLTLSNPGDLAVSLGTSDTVFGITDVPEPSLDGNILPNPVDPKTYMVMLCYKNGSLTREDIRDRYAEKSWDVFNTFLEQTGPLNGGKLGFYYKEHEILPPLRVGFHRYIVDTLTSGSSDETARHQTDEFDPPSEVRAIIEGQFLSMRGHAERCGLPVPPKRIIATGGASSNQAILTIMASIFGCPVYTVQRPDSASLGAALRAAHGWLCKQEGKFVPVPRLYSGRLETTSLSVKLAVPFGDNEGDAELLNRYTLLAKKRLEIEQKLVERFGRRTCTT